MPIPDYQTLMLPLLKYTRDGSEYGFPDAVEAISSEFGLSEEERQKFLPSGNGTVIRNRIGWAKTYLVHAGLLEPTRRGFFKISERGGQVLAENRERIDVKYLDRFPEFQEFRTRQQRSGDRKPKELEPAALETPEETMGAAHQQLRAELESELIAQIKVGSPEFFERLVLTLLLKMGYGGSREDAGRSVGRSGDGGIDGIIKEDRLGLDAIYIQAKRWEDTVGRPEIQKFAGALQGNRARKGVFLTTSSFSREARDFAEMIDASIVLIDGESLARLMVDHNVGVSTVGIYKLQRIDTDFFSEQ